MIIYDYLVQLIIQIFSNTCDLVGVNYWDNTELYAPLLVFLSVISLVLVIYFTLKITVGVIRWFYRI